MKKYCTRYIKKALIPGILILLIRYFCTKFITCKII